MSAGAKHMADIGAAIIGVASATLWALQQATPVMAMLTTLMAFLWWTVKWAKAIGRRWREWRKGRRQ